MPQPFPPPNPLALLYGRARQPLATVVPDTRSGMGRIHWPDGRVSDLLNLSRAKDAAVVIAQRDPSVANWRLLHWIHSRPETRPEAPPVRSAGRPRIGAAAGRATL